MTNQIKNFIEEGEKELSELFAFEDASGDCSCNKYAVLNKAKSIQISLIKMIVEMVEKRKQYLESIITKETRSKILNKIEELEVIINNFD